MLHLAGQDYAIQILCYSLLFRARSPFVREHVQDSQLNLDKI